VGIIGQRQEKEVSAGTTSHVVTFDYNASSIMQYLPSSTTLKEKLKTYSITVQDGGYAVESSRPGSLISPYYSYKWTYNGSVVDLSTFNISRDVIFKAEWIPKEYTIYFEFDSLDIQNRITNLQTSRTYTVESPRIILYQPILEHYYFDGWYNYSSHYQHLYIPERSVGDKVFKARFSPIKYMINYNLDGDHAGNPDYYTIEDEDIILFEPQKTGHIFNGWYADSNFTTKITSIDTSIGRNIEIFPLWQLETYKVTYILPNGLSKVVECEYGKKAPLPKDLDKSIFEIVKTNISRKNITGDTTIQITYVNIWYVYPLALALIAGVIYLIISAKKRRENTHNKLRYIYQSNSNRRK
jgi:uncharacterized repeat protein (TIGR02543 family)